MTAIKRIVLVLIVSIFFTAVSAAVAQDSLPADNGIYSYHRAPRYRESESHPLRIVAYVLHPFGWVLREGITRPLSSLMGSTPFTRSFFGFREPFDYREPMCFSNPEEIPDCRKLAPMSLLGRATETEPTEGTLKEGEKQIFFPNVAFEFDKATLNGLGRGRVRQVSQLLASSPSVNVVVEGHTDYVGTDEYNMKLGQRRADTVKKELSELGIDPARMTTVSYGESRPVFTEDEDWARAVNRRVQFTVGGQAPAEAAK